VVVHFFWFVLWIVLNSGVIAFVHRFDDYPYNLLGIVLSIEAIFITGFLLISQNRQNAHADKRAKLDYEVNVRTYREIRQIKVMLQELAQRIRELRSRSE
jgi:uncharacterized membrane protein